MDVANGISQSTSAVRRFHAASVYKICVAMRVYFSNNVCEGSARTAGGFEAVECFQEAGGRLIARRIRVVVGALRTVINRDRETNAAGFGAALAGRAGCEVLSGLYVRFGNQGYVVTARYARCDVNGVSRAQL